MVLQIVLDLNDLRKIPTFEERFTLPSANIRLVVVPTFVILQLWHLDNSLTSSTIVIIIIIINMWSFQRQARLTGGSSRPGYTFPICGAQVDSRKTVCEVWQAYHNSRCVCIPWHSWWCWCSYCNFRWFLIHEHLNVQEWISLLFYMYATNLKCTNWQEEKRSCKSRQTQMFYTNM